MSIQFFQSVMGKKFYEADVPRLIRTLERIADALEKANEREEKKEVADGKDR